jgi:hypothetical protein
MRASQHISYWQADAKFKHPLLIAKERELEELRATLLMQRAAFGWLVRLRVKQTNLAVPSEAQQARRTSLSQASEVWQSEKNLRRSSVGMAVDDSVVVDAGAAAVTAAIKRQAFQAARHNFELQVATTTVVCEPMDCVLASLLRKVRPSKEAQNDRLVARSLRVVHHPLMWLAVPGTVMYWLESANHTFQWFAEPNTNFNVTTFNSTEYSSTHDWSLNGCTPASDAWLLVAAAICSPPLVLWFLTANVPLIKATGLRLETLFLMFNVARWGATVNFTLDPSCRLFSVLTIPMTVGVLFLWNSIDAVQISQRLRLWVCFFLISIYLLWIYGMITMRGHKKVILTAALGDWWQMETDLLAHELSAVITLLLFATRDGISCLRKPDICKGLQRKVKRVWADRDYAKRGVLKITMSRFGLSAAAAGAAAAALSNNV